MRKISKKLFIFIAMILIVSVSVACLAACDPKDQGGGGNTGAYTDNLDTTDWSTTDSKIAIDTIKLSGSLDLMGFGTSKSGVDLKESTITIKRQYVKNEDAKDEAFPYDMRLEVEGLINLSFSRLGTLESILGEVLGGLEGFEGLGISAIEQVSVKAVVFYDAQEDTFNVYGELDLPKAPGVLNLKGSENEGEYGTIWNKDIVPYVQLKLDMASFYAYDNLVSGDNDSDVALDNWLGLIGTLQDTEIWVKSEQTTVAGLVAKATEYLAIEHNTIDALLDAYTNLKSGKVNVSELKKTDKGGIKKLVTSQNVQVDITSIMNKLLGGKGGAKGNIFKFLKEECELDLQLPDIVNTVAGMLSAGKLDLNVSTTTDYYYTTEASATWGN